MAAAKFLGKGNSNTNSNNSSSHGMSKKQKQGASAKTSIAKLSGGKKAVKTPSTPTSASSTCSSQGTLSTAPTSPASTTSSSSSPLPSASAPQQGSVHAQPPLVATSSTGSSSSGGSSGGQPLSALVVLLESGDWAGAEARARSHPREAKVWATIKSRNSSSSSSSANGAADENAANGSGNKGAKRLPLHHACLKLRNVRCKLAAASTVQALLQAYPDAAKCRETRHGCLPLHLAAFSVSSTSSRISLTSSLSCVSAASLSSAGAASANRAKWEGTTAATATACTSAAGTAGSNNPGQFPDRTTLMQNSVVAVVNPAQGTPSVEIKLTKSPSFNSDADSQSYTSENTGNKDGTNCNGPSSVSTPNSAGAGTNGTPGTGTGSIGALSQVLNGEGKASNSTNNNNNTNNKGHAHPPRRSPIPTGRTVSTLAEDQEHKERQDRIATSIIQMIMDANPRAVKTDSEGGRLPLHMACSGRATPAVVATLLHAYPDACRHRNRDGFLPLHLVAYWGVSDERVAVMLLRAYPDAAVGRNKWGRIPLEEALHVAGENGRSHQDSLVRVLRKHPSYWSRPPTATPSLGTVPPSSAAAPMAPLSSVARSVTSGASPSTQIPPPTAAEPIGRRSLWRNKSASNLMKDEGPANGIAPRPDATKRSERRTTAVKDNAPNRAESPSNCGWNSGSSAEESGGQEMELEEEDQQEEKDGEEERREHKKNLSCPSESELREVFGSFAFDWQCSERPGTGTGDTTTSEADWVISEKHEFHNKPQEAGLVWDSKATNNTTQSFAIPPPKSRGKKMLLVGMDKASSDNSLKAECTEIHVLIKAQEWTSVIRRCEIHPSEVGEWLTVKSQSGRTTRCSPLHYALERNPPAETVEAILRVHPEASTWRAKPSGELPLHVACTWGSSPQVFGLVYEANVDAVRGRDENGNLPIHDACFSGAPAQVIKMLLTAYPKSVHVSNNSGSMPVDIVRRLDHGNKEDVIEILESHAGSMREDEGVEVWTNSTNKNSRATTTAVLGFKSPDWNASRQGGRSSRPEYV